MKNITLIIMLSAFLASCQATAQVENPNSNSVVRVQNSNLEKTNSNVGEIIETQSSVPTTNLSKTTNDVNLKVGIVSVNKNDVICLRTANANLSANSRILIIASPYEKPQKTLKAFIEKKLNNSCVTDDSEAGEDNSSGSVYYAVKLDGNDNVKLDQNDIDKSSIGAGFAILDLSKPVKVSGGLVNVDLNNDGKNEYFRECASNEGLHLTVWTGKPLVGKRIWHRYYYLSYDTDADCKKKDWEGTND